MKATISKTLLALPLFLLVGCGGQPSDPEQAPPADSVSTDGVSSRFQLDKTDLPRLAEVRLPERTLPASAFTQAALAERLLETDETFEQVNLIGRRVISKSRGWNLERSDDGHALVLKTTPSNTPSIQDDVVLQKRSLDRLRAWGVPDEEIGTVLQRTAMVQDKEDGVVLEPRAIRHKTFVWRAIGGIRVKGNRAVITHDLDGSFVRAVLHWPALAKTGHRLNTDITPAELDTRVAEALDRANVPAGSVRLRWKYVATPTEGGEVTLELVVGARIRSGEGEGEGSEPVEIDVDTSAR
jgi:hypothetical protein